MSAVYALYPTPGAAQRAVDQLRAAGVEGHRIIVISSEPFEEYPFARGDKATWMFWMAGAGGVVGLTFATWLTRMTELAWPLQTGSMPIVSWWPNLIIMFELTMLFAILATVITLLVTARLPTWRTTLYDPAVTDGQILVGVENPSQTHVPDLERALLAGGAADLKRV